jgi:hypothetical protein
MCLAVGTAYDNGPGGVLVGFVINIEHMCVIVAMMIPIGSVLYQATSSIYPGDVLNALLVTWMFTSSSVIAPCRYNYINHIYKKIVKFA